jgi:muramoyltetrapeptide carboxypeptidase
MTSEITINLFAPSGPYSSTELEENLVRFLQIKPPQLTLGIPECSQHHTFNYLHDTDENQTHNFLEAIKTCDILWCIRGGYGASRWIGSIDWDKTINQVFPLIAGFSDVTFLHCAIVSNGGTSLHCPMPLNLNTISAAALNSMLKAFLHKKVPTLYGTPLHQGRTEGILAGGNLTCICHTIGTAIELEWENIILFIEDCNEALYRIDRMLTWLIANNILKQIKGLAIGAITGTGATSSEFVALLNDRLAGLNIPVIYNLPAGHIKDNMPLLLGHPYKLDTTKTNALIPLSTYTKGL